MKITLAAVTAVTGLVVAPAAFAAPKDYKATLNGAQEVPACAAIATKATGTATLKWDPANGSLTGTVKLVPNGNLTSVQAQHIHDATCGTAGGVLLALPAPVGDTITINTTIKKAADVTAFDTAIDKGELYVNVHTKDCASGEIRGQIYPAASTTTCPATAADAGADASTSDGGSTSSSSSGGSSTSSSGGSSTSSSSGASTERADSGTENAAPADDGGCSTTGSRDGSGNGLAIALGLGVAVAGVARARKKTKR